MDWRQYVEPKVVSKYEQQASDVLTVQCVSCHKRGSMHVASSLPKDGWSVCLDVLSKRHSPDAVTELNTALEKYLLAKEPARELVRVRSLGIAVSIAKHQRTQRSR